MDEVTGQERHVLEGADLMKRLYPGTVAPTQLIPNNDRRGFVVLPGARDPRLYVPQAPLGGAKSLRRARRTSGVRQRLGTLAAVGYLIVGGGRFSGTRAVFDVRGSLESELAKLLGMSIGLAVFLGPRRANRKPVLQLLDRRGRLLAVAKVGINDLTSRLVVNEARALEFLAAHQNRSFRTPQLLGVIEWSGHSVVVQSPLSIRSSGAVDAPVLTRAMVEIAAIGGRDRESLAEGDYVRRLRGRVEAMRDHPAARCAGLETLDALSASGGSIEVGSWHGDLTRWNVSTRRGVTQVWDWERFESGVPVGLDALHSFFLPCLAAGEPLWRAGLDLMERSEELLRPFEFRAEDSRVVALLYLLEIASRFSGDGQAAAANAAGRVETWLLPVLETVVQDRRA